MSQGPLNQQFELERLYQLYLSGQISDMGNTSDLLQVARAIGPGMTFGEFSMVFGDIEQLQADQDEMNSEASRAWSGPIETIRGMLPRWMPGSEYQSRLWELPEYYRRSRGQGTVQFMPSRLRDGTPFALDSTDPAGTQERLRSLPYSDVRHDPRLRDAWHAAQTGKLEALLENNALWQSQTDPGVVSSVVPQLASSQRTGLTAPLRSLLEAHDEGSLQGYYDHYGRAYSQQQPTHSLYQMDAGALLRQFMAANRFAPEMVNGSASEMNFGGHTLRGLGEQSASERSEEAVRNWIAGMRDWHEQQTRQSLVDRQLMTLYESGSRQPPILTPISASDAVDAIVNRPAGAEVAPPPVLLPISQQTGTSALDAVQNALHGAGMVDPTPVVDGANAAISLGRAVTSGDSGQASGHLRNALSSLAGMLPYVGNLLQLGLGRTSGVAGESGIETADRQGVAAVPGGIANTGGAATPRQSLLGALFGGAAAAIGSTGGSGGGGGSIPPVTPPSGTPGDAGGNYNPGGTQPGVNATRGVADTLANIAGAFGAIGAVGYAAYTRVLRPVADWFVQLDANNRNTLDANRGLAQYNGVLAASYMQYDARNVRREIARGGELDDVLSDLAESQSDFADEMQRFTIPFEKAQLWLRDILTDVSVTILKGINDTAASIGQQLGLNWQTNEVEDKARSAFQHAMESRTRNLQNRRL